MTRCLRGEAGAWEEFLDRYGRLIWSTAHRCGASGEEAEEIFQRSWVAVIEGLGRLENPEGIVAWIVSLTRYQSWRLFDENKKHRGSGEKTSPEEGMDAQQEEALLKEESGILIHQALERLPRACRQLIDLLFFTEPRPDYKEISRRLGIAVGSIGPIRARCLRKLKKVYLLLYHQDRKGDS